MALGAGRKHLLQLVFASTALSVGGGYPHPFTAGLSRLVDRPYSGAAA